MRNTKHTSNDLYIDYRDMTLTIVNHVADVVMLLSLTVVLPLAILIIKTGGGA